MSPALANYLSQVEAGLRGVSRRRRAMILRELACHLQDEADARDLQGEVGMAALLAEKEGPGILAQELSAGEGQDATHRGSSALVAGMILGVVTGGHMLIEGWHWFICLPFGAAEGLAVGSGFFWIRRHWARLGPAARLAVAVVITTLLSIPLGFTTTHGFKPTRLMYGAYTGYLLERHALDRPSWQLVLEPVLFTVLVFAVEVGLLGRVRFEWWKVAYELSFNITLLLAVKGALKLKRLLSERWIGAPQQQE